MSVTTSTICTPDRISNLAGHGRRTSAQVDVSEGDVEAMDEDEVGKTVAVAQRGLKRIEAAAEELKNATTPFPPAAMSTVGA
jgi:hypothetical protein